MNAREPLKVRDTSKKKSHATSETRLDSRASIQGTPSNLVAPEDDETCRRRANEIPQEDTSSIGSN